jgi:hypothetical protein
MNEVMGLFAKYLAEKLDYPVFVERAEDLTIEEYVILTWTSRTHDEAVRGNTHVFKCHIEAYSRKSNPYSHYIMAEAIINLLPHKISLGEHVVDVDKVCNYMELDGAKKADILVTLTERV